MAVFRIEKNKDYTVMSNYHLRDSSLSLKAKGLLSQMLSLPEGWDYTLSGLAALNKESKDAIRSAVNELEKAGYVVRRQTADEKGKFASNEYIIYEQPVSAKPLLDFPTTENPATENPLTDNPLTENPSSENPTQLNKDILNTDISKKKSKKEKGRNGKETVDPLPLFVAWIDQTFPNYPPAKKNALYQALARFADNRVSIKRPMQSMASVTALCNRLLRITQESGTPLAMMIDLLDTATSSGWQSVYPPKNTQNSTTPQNNGGVVYKEI